jgi:hypothetical protein
MTTTADELLFGPMPYRDWKNNKRWLRTRHTEWCEENPNVVPPWFDRAELTQWYQARALLKKEHDEIEHMQLPAWVHERFAELEARVAKLEKK